MKKIVIFIIASIIMLLSACTSKDTVIRDYYLKGEDENWIAEYKGYSKGYFFKEKDGKLNYKGEKDEILTLTYKRELSELSNVRKVEYKFSNGGGSLEFDKEPDTKVFSWKSKGNGGIVAVQDTEKVTVFIDGKTETIEMKILK